MSGLFTIVTKTIVFLSLQELPSLLRYKVSWGGVFTVFRSTATPRAAVDSQRGAAECHVLTFSLRISRIGIPRGEPSAGQLHWPSSGQLRTLWSWPKTIYLCLSQISPGLSTQAVLRPTRRRYIFTCSITAVLPCLLQHLPDIGRFGGTLVFFGGGGSDWVLPLLVSISLNLSEIYTVEYLKENIFIL